jgi:osmotically-inducible protein OsmY
MMRKLVPLLVIVLVAPFLSGCVGLALTGAAAAAVMVDDRRTTGIYVEDENIEWKALARFNNDFKGSHINATSFNQRVLLTGEVATEETKKAAEQAVKAITSVREVANELSIGGNSSFASRGNDAGITTNVKARMLGNGKFSTNHVKVLTEAGVVYLMGLVTQSEGEAAVEIARSTSGVSRVVKVFEYVVAK